MDDPEPLSLPHAHRARSPRPLAMLLVSVMASTGLVSAVGPVRAASPEPSAAPSPAVVTVGGYAIDPATGLPVVPEGVGGPWWWIGLPTQSLDPSLRYTSARPEASALDPSQDRVSLLARFGSFEEARAVAEELDAALGDPAAEAAWLASAGQQSQPSQPPLGFDRLPSESALTPFVQVVDRWLIVSELAYRRGYDPGDSLDKAPRYQSPLALALADLSQDMVVEDTSSDDKFVAFDLSCTGEDAPLLTLSQDLADNAELYDMQPVWLGDGITDAQRRARRTLRLLDVLDAQALAGLAGDPDYEKLAAAARDAGKAGATAAAEAIDSLSTYIEEWLLSSRPDLRPLAEVLDAQVVQASAASFARRAARAVLVGSQTRPFNVASGRFEAAPYGAHDAPIPWIMGNAHMYAGYEPSGGGSPAEVDLSLGLFDGVAAGLGPLVDYLDGHGCGDIKVAFTDYGYGIDLRRG